MKFYFCITGYNCEAFVKECLNSVKAQTLKNWHCVIINDGSTDGTRQEIEKEIATDHRFFLIDKKTNEGPASARFYGLRHIKKISNPEDVILLVDLDDYLAHSKVLERVNLAYKQGADLTYGQVESNGPKIHINKYPYSISTVKNKAYRNSEWLCYPLRTFKAKLFKSYINKKWFQWPNGEWISVCTDVALMHLVLEQANKPVYIAETLYIYRFDNPLSMHNRWNDVVLKRIETNAYLNVLHKELKEALVNEGVIS